MATIPRLGSWTTVCDPTPWGAEDGAGLVYFNNAFYRICGWSVAGGSHNHVFRSVDRGANWTQLSDMPGIVRHAMPCKVYRENGVDYAYVVGGDGETGGNGPGDIRRFDGTNWETICTSSPTLNRTLHMFASIGTTQYIFGGQTDPSVAASATKNVFQSTDGGRNWIQLAEANWQAAGVGAVGTFQGRIVKVGGGASDATSSNDTYSNAVDVFDGSTWTNKLPEGHSVFPAAKYRLGSGFEFDGMFWVCNGSGSGRTDLKVMMCSRDLVNWFDVTNFQSCSARHADSWATDSTGVLHLGGVAVGAGPDATQVHRWDLI